MVSPPGAAPHEPLLISGRILEIRRRIGVSAAKSGRTAGDIRLVAVTKTVPAGPVVEALDAGIAEIAESRVQEATEKFPEIEQRTPRRPSRHFIGQLQTNKARRAVEMFDVIQSVDRWKVAQALDRIAQESGKKQACLIEIKISEEPTKSGVPLGQVASFLDQVSALQSLSVQGLMTIAPLDVSADQTKELFASSRAVFEKFLGRFGSAPIFSMGMSDDFEMAIEQGSTMVRVGRAIFGERR